MKIADCNQITHATNRVRDSFEMGFLGIPLDVQVSQCDRSELSPLFERWLPENQPVLEAGSGSGRWVAWFLRKGWSTVGLDWSEALCARAQTEIPGSSFESGDMRKMPFDDCEFGAIVALGSIEHVPEGPANVLKEFARVLRMDGIAIITVPFEGPVRRFVSLLKTHVRNAKASRILRWLFGKTGTGGRSLKATKREVSPHWRANFHRDSNGWHFYQYLFTRGEMQILLESAGFKVLEESVIMTESGVFNTFGRLAGSFDPFDGIVRLSFLGKLLHHLIPADAVGHMLCYVVRRT